MYRPFSVQDSWCVYDIGNKAGKKRELKERLTEKKKFQEGTNRNQHHREVGSLIIDGLLFFSRIGVYERHILTRVLESGWPLRVKLQAAFAVVAGMLR